MEFFASAVPGSVHLGARGARPRLARRVGEDVATLTPHRSGRAELPLPVLHGRVSLTDVVVDTIPDSPVKKVAEVKRHPSFRSCRFSYPLSFRGQVVRPSVLSRVARQRFSPHGTPLSSIGSR
jgi:hypothetical protein